MHKKAVQGVIAKKCLGPYNPCLGPYNPYFIWTTHVMYTHPI
jgi:hypothetical protein